MAAGVEQCVNMLQSAPNDTDKFAALLMVTKLVKADDCSAEDKCSLFNAIGFSYIMKMLTSPGPDGCPPDIFKSIGLTILGCFAQDPLIGGSTEMAESVSAISGLLPDGGEDDDCGMISASDVLQCLECAAVGESGRAALGRPAVLLQLVDTVCEQRTGSVTALRVLHALAAASSAGRLWSDQLQLFGRLMRTLVDELQYESGAPQLAVCGPLRALLLSAPSLPPPLDDAAPGTEPQRQWQRPLCETLARLLVTRLPAEQRSAVLSLAAAALQVLGLQHTGLSADQQKQFIIVTTNLLCIEIRMGMEDRDLDQVIEAADLLCSGFIVLEAVFCMLIGDEPIELDAKQKQQLIVALRGATTAVVRFLTSVVDLDLDDMTPTQNLFIRAAAKVLLVWLAEETSYPDEVMSVFPFLLRVCITSFQECRMNNTNNPIESVPTAPVANGNNRSDTNGDNGNIANDEKENGDSGNTANGDKENGDNGSAANGDNGSTINGDNGSAANGDNGSTINGDNGSTINGDTNGVTVVAANGATNGDSGACPDLLRLFLPALCHLTADDRAREMLLQMEVDEILLHFFHCRWDENAEELAAEAPRGSSSDTVQALITACSCLMNIAVLEPGRVAASAAFLGLQKTLVQRLAEVHPSRLVLHSNLLVLGLLMLHRHPASPSLDQSRLVRFVQGAVRFLWDAHNVEDSRDQSSVVVSTRYRGVWCDLQELWLLGLQVLAQLAGGHGWLAEFIVETGWPEAVVSMLARVRYGHVEETVMRALEAFLLGLCRVCETARRALLQANTPAVCRTHRLRDLAKLLKQGPEPENAL